MSEPFIGEIKMFASNFAPRGYAFANGQLLPISQNTALFALYGTIYGGDGRTTMGLPNMQGRFPMGPRNGPGLSPRQLGQQVGVEAVALTANQMGVHAHGLRASGDDASTADPTGAAPAVLRDDGYSGPGDTTMDADTIAAAGGGQPHDNVHPYQVVTFIVALTGVFPSRS